MLSFMDRRCAFVILLYISTVRGDPCKTSKTLHDLERRLTNYAIDAANGEEEICDKYRIPIDGAWYRVGLQDMPTTAPPFDACGSTFPIWLQGTVPAVGDGIVDRIACMKGPSVDCTKQYNIQIKNCINYNVYFLVPVDDCPVSYCFGEGVRDKPPTFKPQKPEIKTSLDDGHLRLPELLFHCNFEAFSNETLFYQIFWYIDGHVVQAPTVHHNDLHNQNVLREGTTTFEKVGINVQCRVRAKYLEDGRGGPIALSDTFFAGFKISATSVDIDQGEEKKFQITPTVPFGCFRNDRPCDLKLEMTIPRDDDKCKGIIRMAKNCFTKISSHGFMNSTDITIKYIGTDSYVPSNSVFDLHLKTAEAELQHPAWHDYFLPVLKVRVHPRKDVQLLKKSCYSLNDPHLKTFDGRYYDVHSPGPFIFYDHTGDPDKIMQVQLQYQPCSGIWIYCNCGIAVRAGGDLFVIDNCSGRRVFQFIKCGDGILRAYKYKYNVRKYTIWFPTGTKVIVDVDRYQRLNIRMTPSDNDKRNTRGLCGNLNGDPKDDFQMSDGKLTNNRFTFADSWRPTKAGQINLFQVKSTFDLPRWKHVNKFCTCVENTTNGANSNDGDFECSPSEEEECSRQDDFDNVGTHICFTPNQRRKRSLDYPWHSFERRKRSVSTTNALNISIPENNVTKEEAEAYCKKFMESSRSFNACREVPNTPTEEALSICAVDYQLTGTTDWSAQTLETMKGSCFDEIRKNETLRESSDGSPSVAETVLGVLCPGVPECSGNGNCENGTCQCNDGYGSSDCSIDLKVPPELTGLRGEGLCDVNEISCDTAYVIGPEILNSEMLTCKLKEFQLSLNGTRTALKENDISGVHETLIEVHCPFPKGRKRRNAALTSSAFIHGYTISISYDGAHFGEEFDYFAFDDICQIATTTTESATFKLRDNYCFIEGKCVTHGQKHPSSKCLICDSGRSPISWSQELIEECLPPTVTHGQDNDTDDKLWIIGAVIGGVLAACCGVGFIIVVYKYQGRRKKIGDSQVFNTVR